ncbi:MAG TPA: S9 family peptidase [Steroidobacteraceae bacterium]|jgi:dipeptidyl aminopeptidase/acylaminoacyl peptidase
MRPLALLFLFALVTMDATAASATTPARRELTADDINAIKAVSDPQLSPDGQWVAYAVRTNDIEKDERTTHLWMTAWDGKRSVPLTNSSESEHTPRWSPDGSSLGFLSARGAKDGPEQLWLLDRTGGEARELTSFKGSVVDYTWSPDGKRIALIVQDEDLSTLQEADKDKTPPPLVIDRYYFKEDETGYLGAVRQHLYVLDLATNTSALLTPGSFDESVPTWSPDGKLIAFASKRAPDPDRNSEFGLYVIAARMGSEPRLLTTFQGEAGDSEWMSGAVWRPDGKQIAFVAAGDPKLIYYSTHHLFVMPAAGGTAQMISGNLDRNVAQPHWSTDGKSIYALVEDDLNQHLVKLNVSSGRLEPLLEGRRETTAFDLGAHDRVVILDSTIDSPNEVYALDGKAVRPLSNQNSAWLQSVKLGSVENISFASKDGTRISGFIVTPPDYVAGRRYPTLLQIHGGPVSQFANAFMPAWQILAAQGYVVVAANPRGSSGRGEAFATAIYADWGNKDSEDVLGAVDYAVSKGIADPERLGVGGWSYGGILTNFVIARDSRFKVATSGASIGNVLAGYGTDMYIREYEQELGTPWANLDVWLRISYPFLHANKIKTPTLFLCGERDFNVPLPNSEQMYQALKSLGVDTQLIIYPSQYHGLSKPTYLRDRMRRYVQWYGKYLGM